MKFIFEDNESTPSSQLLKSCYAGEDILFSGGVTQLIPKIRENIEEDVLLVFVDVVPDNEVTIKWYRTVCSTFKQAKNVHVIPVPCIEYYIICMLVQFGYLEEKLGLEGLVYPFENFTMPVMGKTLEKKYKNLLSYYGQSRKCLLNSLHNGESGLRGKFYLSACTCSACRWGCNVSLGVKADQLYTRLPVFRSPFSWEQMRIKASYSRVTLRQVFIKQANFYDRLCDSMGISRIDILSSILCVQEDKQVVLV